MIKPTPPPRLRHEETRENSPAINGWVVGSETSSVRQGRKNRGYYNVIGNSLSPQTAMARVK